MSTFLFHFLNENGNINQHMCLAFHVLGAAAYALRGLVDPRTHTALLQLLLGKPTLSSFSINTQNVGINDVSELM